MTVSMTEVPTSSSVYYKDRYWNDHQLTIDYMSRLVTDLPTDKPRFWMAHVKSVYFAEQPARRALFINCGNGWAERDLYDLGVFESGIGYDYSHDLLKQAQTAAGSRKLSYFRADCNALELPENHFDLIVNVAAMHHVQFINRMHEKLARALTPDGYFINFDYVGPHRNQYSKEHFATMVQINDTLPKSIQNDHLVPPHLETMLATDPTEAIHSELIMEMFERFFIPVERKDLNGGIAYQILHNNHELLTLDLPAAHAYLQSLLEQDELYSLNKLVPTLFSFFVGRPRKSVLENTTALSLYTQDEMVREEYAKGHAGRYNYSLDVP